MPASIKRFVYLSPEIHEALQKITIANKRACKERTHKKEKTVICNDGCFFFSERVEKLYTAGRKSWVSSI
ncbi:MAG: hypothetical protein LBU77_01815 [Clostridiales bacterium]|jgi:hypothetical protein|nr:hypothetical protein [Clostridiales bacterium]